MQPSSSKTIAVYNQMAGDYLDLVTSDEPSTEVVNFLTLLPNDAKVLDIGCGPGNSALAMMQAGCDVDAFDASAEMVAIACDKFGVNAKVAAFSDLNAVDEYDGIFANFCLLHAPRSEFSDHIARIYLALKPNGIFHIALKTGTGQRTDKLGRFYTYYEPEELRRLLEVAGFSIEVETTGKALGLAGNVEPYIVVIARG